MSVQFDHFTVKGFGSATMIESQITDTQRYNRFKIELRLDHPEDAVAVCNGLKRLTGVRGDSVGAADQRDGTIHVRFMLNVTGLDEDKRKMLIDETRQGAMDGLSTLAERLVALRPQPARKQSTQSHRPGRRGSDTLVRARVRR